jgi:hypothetical protein
MKWMLLAAAVSSGLSGAAPARAVPVLVSFTAGGISGSFEYEASSITGPIQSLDAVNLTIAGFAYSTSNVGFISTPPTEQVIGGTANGVAAVVNHADDFVLAFNPVTGAPLAFFYATSSTDVSVARFTGFSITPATVAPPEPESWTMLLLGVLGVFLVHRARHG